MKKSTLMFALVCSAASCAAETRPETMNVAICILGPIPGTVVESAALVALDDALQEFARIDPRKARVVELRYFGGLDVEETAQALGVHPNTVIRDWSLAKAWLKRELSPSDLHAG